MKTVILDCWFDNPTPEHIISITAVEDDTERVFPNNYRPPTHFILAWKSNGVCVQHERPVEKKCLIFPLYPVAIFKIRPRH